jgi:hypothetical protein
MQITDKREQRLMTAAPEALEMERSSIQRFADKLEIDQTIGLLDAGGVQVERELLDWRIDTFNQALEQRPDLKVEAIDAFSVYTGAAMKALDRRQVAEQSYRQQSPELLTENKPADDGIRIVPRENGRGYDWSFENREGKVLMSGYGNDPEDIKGTIRYNQRMYPGRYTYDTEERIDKEAPREAIVDLFANQENNIREEWLADLQTGRLDSHALDSYFAGRVDQHNTLIGMAVEAHPHLRETLPPPIQYGQIRDDLQRQIAQAQQVGERNTHAVEEQFRFAV